MPAAANIVINDGAGSPVAHTFSPLGKDPKGVYRFEQTVPTPTNVASAKRLGVSQVRSFGTKGALTSQSKVIWTIDYPTMETLGTNDAGITPAPTVAYVNSKREEYTLPERGSTQERKDVRTFGINLGANAIYIATIDALQPVY
jgi:hypothetical protein